MNRNDDRTGQPRTEPKTKPEQRDPQETTTPPPIEREHETQQGAIEEDPKDQPERK